MNASIEPIVYDGSKSELYVTGWNDCVAALRNTDQPSAPTLYQHLLAFLGAKDHADAARIIAGYHLRETTRPRATEAVALSPHSRAMLLNVLWHHQGGSSAVGQPLRSILGIGQHDRLDADQVNEAKRIDGLLADAVAPLAPRESGERIVLASAQIAQLAEFAGRDEELAIEDQAHLVVERCATGHSGPGVYAHYEDLPDEGALFLDGRWPELSAAPREAVHPDDAAADRFSDALKVKLAEARAKGRGGWENDEPGLQQRLSDMLREHVGKGDPRDVANFCMFLHQRGQVILPASETAQEPKSILLSARKLTWNEEPLSRATSWREWSDRRMGFHISYDPEADAADRYTAAWGEGEPEQFATVEEAKAWCQEQADSWVREVALASDAQRETAQGRPAYWLAVNDCGVVERGLPGDDANDGEASRTEMNDWINDKLDEDGECFRLVAVYTRPAPQQRESEDLVQVARIDANNYCRILSALGMEEEGDPVAEVLRLKESEIPTAPLRPVTDESENHKLDTDTHVFFYEQDFYVLSNFSAFCVVFDGSRFDTSEAAYHFQKFPDSTPIQNAIRLADSAHEAFKLAERHKDDRRSDWDAIKFGVMRRILRAKVDQHEYVRRKLLATGDRILVEDSWRDGVWGWGPNRDGQNMLGKLWMEIRDELRNERSRLTGECA